jgi:hypothetical protein
VVPAVAAGGATASWVNLASTVHTNDAALQGGYNPFTPTIIEQISVNGSLPQAPVPLPLPAYELPNGPLGIPATALAAYKNAAAIMARKQPNCHLDWALIASIGRIESNHARGGYVNAKGDTLEPILGPVLNGIGPFAVIPDTDQGRFDGDKVWDRAVGPMQFIPGTWLGYASDGNGDGKSNPHNIYDATLATGRYLCSGRLDVANPDQLRAAIFRYNHSDTYVNTVILWAEAYRSGVMSLSDSKVPVGAPNGTLSPGPLPVPPPPAPPVTTTGTSTTSSVPPSTSSSPSNTSASSSTPTTTTPTTTPTTCGTSPPSVTTTSGSPSNTSASSSTPTSSTPTSSTPTSSTPTTTTPTTTTPTTTPTPCNPPS